MEIEVGWYRTVSGDLLKVQEEWPEDGIFVGPGGRRAWLPNGEVATNDYDNTGMMITNNEHPDTLVERVTVPKCRRIKRRGKQ